MNAGVPRAADPPLGAKVLNQLLFQRSPRLDEQTAINRFVRHAQALVVGVLRFQPSGNLFRRPVLHQFTRNHLLQLAVGGQQARLRPQGRLPGLGVGFTGSILRVPAMSGYLPTHCRESALQTLRDGPHRLAGGDSARDVFAFGQSEYSLRTATSGWRNPTMTLQQEMNDHMIFADRSTNGMQRFSRLPTTPDLSSLRRRKLSVVSGS